ncbi:MAG: hypothetical protein Q9219_006633 [cf. Caloplaca sp. 3 TL-2023]
MQATCDAGELPALRDDSIWIGGFQNIVHHLHCKSNGSWSADRDCDAQTQADISATWILPPKRRAAAKLRTDHLNFSSLDLDTAEEGEAITSQFAAGTEIPRVLRTSKQTVTALVKQPQHAARFRLDTLADAFFEPLAHLLQGQRYLLSEQHMTSLDCLALGHLSLALLPEVPQPWLSQSMRSRYPSLCHYVQDLARACFGVVVHVQGDDKNRAGRSVATRLPWRSSDAETTPTVIMYVRSALENLPYLGALYRPGPLQESSVQTHDELTRMPVIPSAIVGLAAGITALTSYALFTGELPSVSGFPWLFNIRPQRRHLSDLGDAGAMLGAMPVSRGTL